MIAQMGDAVAFARRVAQHMRSNAETGNARQIFSPGAQALLLRACDGQVGEVILATGFTADGEVTAHALSEALKHRGLKVTRLARGVPVGSDIEFVDLGTIAHAFADRR